jgi:outer membrane lipoprotein-sorting protein
MIRVGVVALLLTGGVGVGQDLSGEPVLEHLLRGMEGVEDYTATLNIVADIEGMSVPPMMVTMYFKQPDKVHFESDGFALIPREGLAMNLGTLTANFSVDRVDWDTVHGARAYRLTLLPRSERTRTRRVQLLVDPEHWTAERIVTNTVDGRSIAATFRYVQVEDFWLPSHLDVTLASAEQDSSQLPPWEAQPGTSSRRRGPLKGTLEIRYSNYRVNTGLSDDLFHTREEPQDR